MVSLSVLTHHPPVRQMVILIVPAEGRLTRVSSLLGSLECWVVELELDRDHMKPKECLSSTHWEPAPLPPGDTVNPAGSWGVGHAFGVAASEPSVRLAQLSC